jgi:hypothetical protein
MPGPVSDTHSSTPPDSQTPSAALTVPASVNFVAFARRLVTIWRSRVTSPSTHAGTSSATSQASSTPRASAAG